MALDIWLPLIGNTVNQGTRPVSITASSPAYSTFGKIGEKGLSAGSISISAADANKILNNEEISVAFWVYVNVADGTSRATTIFGNTGMTPPNNRKFAIFQYPTVNDIHFSWQNETDDTFLGGLWNDVLPSYKWTHVAVTYKNPTAKLFINGVLKATVTGASASNSFEFATTIARSDGINILNDLRVYSHCISDKEVRLLSQGLIAHYKLSDMDLEKTTNVAPYPTPGSAVGAVGWDQSLHPGAINISGWSYGYNNGVGTPASGYHAYWKLIDGLPTMVFPDLNSFLSLGHRWLGINASGMQSKIGPNTTYTISFDSKADVDGMLVRTGYYYGLTGATGNNFHDGYGDFIVTKNWKRYSCTFTTKSNLNASIGASIYFYGHNGSVSGTSYVRNIQVEVKNHSTAYTQSSRSTTILQDVSGYRRHGSIVGSVTTNKDSARYDNCIYITDGRSNYGKGGTMTMPTDQVTMSCWIKSSTTGYSSYHIPLSFSSENYELSIDSSGHFRNGFKINGTRSALTTSHTSILDGKWHMITATYDGATIRRYVDGVELTSYATAVTGSLAGGSGTLLIGNYSGTTYGNCNMYMSDVRIYSTALGATEILDLYQTRMAMAHTGSGLAYEYIEDDPAPLKITEEGLLRTGNASEIVSSLGMKTKTLSDGSAWARIHWLDVSKIPTFFTAAEVNECIAPNRYSQMQHVDKFVGKKFTITNLMPAVNTTNYSGGVASTTYKKYSSASLQVTGTTDRNEMFLTTTGTIPYVKGHTYYGRAEIYQTTKQGGCDLYWKIAEPRIIAGKTVSAASTWTRISSIRTPAHVANTAGADWESGNYQARWDYNNSKTAGDMWFDGMMLIDLTATFGAGKEPTAAWCDENIPYFVGTKTIEINDSNIGWYEFMLTYPRLSATGYNRWKQTSSPSATASVNYTPISISWADHAGGIRKGGGDAIYNCDSVGTTTWYAAIGQTKGWTNNSIPGSNGGQQTETELWVRIDTLPKLNKLSIVDNNYLQSSNIYEI